MKGDRVEIVVDTGTGAKSFEISARRAGRRVDISVSRGVVEVSEVTRGGTSIRTGRFMANRIIALVEHPAVDPFLESDEPSPAEQTVSGPGAGGRSSGRGDDESRGPDGQRAKGKREGGGRPESGREERLPDELWNAETPEPAPLRPRLLEDPGEDEA